MRSIRSCLRPAAAVVLACASSRAQTTSLASVDSSGLQGNGISDGSSISADGRFVAFDSVANNLVPGDTNVSRDVFVRDLQARTTTRVSVDSSGAEGDFHSSSPEISADGRFVVFQSEAGNLVPGDSGGWSDVFVHDSVSGATTRVSVASDGTQGDNHSGFFSCAISSDGRWVAFESQATNLVPGDTNATHDIFVRDLVTGTTARVSIDSAGTEANGGSVNPSISADGRWVAFGSEASNLVPGDTNPPADVFVHDRLSGATTRVSAASDGTPGNHNSGPSAISSDGRCVAFASLASNLVTGDTNGVIDVFVRDLQVGVTTRVSVASGGIQGSGSTSFPLSVSISSDGRFVAFDSTDHQLVPGDTNGTRDVFLHDRLSAVTSRESVASDGTQGVFLSLDPAISADGRFAVFWSLATNLVPSDTNGFRDVFVHDRGDASAFTPLCFGDGSAAACPCANSGVAGHGCENSAATGGALLTATGVASLSADTVQLQSSGELASVLSVVVQGDAAIAPVSFGDGLRCAGGNLKRMRAENAVSGTVVYPDGTETAVSVQSSNLGDPIALGATRIYQVYYRDPSASFCADPPGSAFNVSNAVAIAWGA